MSEEVNADEPITVEVTLFDGDRVVTDGLDPTSVSVRSTDLQARQATTWPTGRLTGEGRIVFTMDGLRRGLHRIEVSVGGASDVSELVSVG